MDQEPQSHQPDSGEYLSISQNRQIRDLYDAMQIVHRKVIAEDKDGFDGRDVVEINKSVLESKYLLNPHLFGQLRKRNVTIVSTINGKQRVSSVKPVDAKELPFVFLGFSNKLKEKTAKISSSSTVEEVLDTAAWAHIEIIRIHPFMDGNGRTARLFVDLIFERADLPYITDWGSKDREYIETVYETHKQNKPEIFQLFIAKKLRASINELAKVGSGVAAYVEDTREQVDRYIFKLQSKND